MTVTNSASPITSPANGLMVFNTVTAGTSPNQVVPGYYYWDGTGQKWVSLSTTVGNVQNQEDIDFLKSWIRKRLTWMDSEIGKL